MRKLAILSLILLINSTIWAQTGIIRGRIADAVNQQPLAYASILVQEVGKGAYSDENGAFEITGLEPGLYNIKISYTGYKSKTLYEQQVSNSKPLQIEVLLEQDNTASDTVNIVANVGFDRKIESPNSIKTIGVNEIERNPGGNRDISRVIQSLPGVSSTVGFRNDIIIRGGAPNENRFYLDGIEVPNINHFSTQGASGGPVGLINVNFIREVDFYTGAFPANRGNTLSSVMEIKQKNGREDRLGLNFTLGSSDIGLTLEGPLSEKTTFLASGRRSYLQGLFSLLGLPFLPTYNDFQFKTRTMFSPNDELTVIGLGAIDDFALNLEADSTEEQRYILANLPVTTQWNYTIGVRYRHFGLKGTHTLVGSRNMLNNESYKYENNDESNPSGLIQDYTSQEIENKFRYEYTFRAAGVKINTGANYEYVRYLNSTFNRISTPNGLDTVDFNSALDVHKYGVFAQASKSFLGDRLSLSLGLRMDGNSYSQEMQNPLEQFSPRFSASYQLTRRLSVNFNTGRYYQLPPYTILGYRDASGTLTNRQNEVKYIQSDHLVAGIAMTTGTNTRFTAEGFYKRYNRYPFLLRDSISLANLGGDFGVIGNEPATSTSEGRSYGLEITAQQKLYKGFFGILAYTFVRSEFTDGTGEFVPSAWDNRHIITFTGGKKFKKNWELGLRWRYYGGTPYTPFDVGRSSLITVWNITGRGLPDYNRLNTLRLSASHQLDLRLDKKFFFKKWSLNCYIDIQNVYNFQAQGQSFLDVQRNNNAEPIVDPNDPNRYLVRTLNNTTGSVLPTIGVIIEI